MHAGRIGLEFTDIMIEQSKNESTGSHPDPVEKGG